MSVHRNRRSAACSAALATAALAAGVLLPATATAAEPRRADVSLTATPATLNFAAPGRGKVRLTYANPGNVAKDGATISAAIPEGLTVTATPAAGWECHVDDFPALVCNSADTLKPGQTVVPAVVTLHAAAPVRTTIEFGTLGFYRDPTENPADNYATVTVAATG